MYIAHAGEIHKEVANHSTNQLACIIGAALLAAVVLAVVVFLDIRRKRATKTITKK